MCSAAYGYHNNINNVFGSPTLLSNPILRLAYLLNSTPPLGSSTKAYRNIIYTRSNSTVMRVLWGTVWCDVVGVCGCRCGDRHSISLKAQHYD